MKKRPINAIARKTGGTHEGKANDHQHQMNQHLHDTSVCLTEENRHVCTVNPVNLADKDWTDPYKLNKLLTQQRACDINELFPTQCPMLETSEQQIDYCPVYAKIDCLFADLSRMSQKKMKSTLRSQQKSSEHEWMMKTSGKNTRMQSPGECLGAQMPEYFRQAHCRADYLPGPRPRQDPANEEAEAGQIHKIDGQHVGNFPG